MATPENGNKVKFIVDTRGQDSESYDNTSIVFDTADNDIYVGTHPIIEPTKNDGSSR